MIRKNDNEMGRWFAELEIGKTYQHKLQKKITSEEHNQFCKLTMNNHPLHLDAEFAKSTQFGKIVVVGTYIASIVVGLSVSDISGKAVANLEYENIIHHAPVFINDTIRAETKVFDKWLSRSNPNRGIVLVETEAFNQDNKLVLSLKRKVLIPKKG